VLDFFVPPPERLSLRGLWGPPLQNHPQVPFLLTWRTSGSQVRSERKGEKWIRAGVHALASFAAAGVMASWWSPIGVEAGGGRWRMNWDPGHGGCL
jgi:hypothetical protein